MMQSEHSRVGVAIVCVNFRDGAGQPGYEIRQQFLCLALELI